VNVSEAEHLTINEASALFRIGRTKLYELINSGHIRAFKLGRRTLVLASSVREFVETLPTAGVVR
jgi:excisionase family DNA binding protein